MIFKRGVFRHIADAAEVHHTGKTADLVLNCTGLSAGKLGGVMDANMIPARGQTVLVRNEANVMADSSGTDEGDDEVCYVMQRAAGKCTECYQSRERLNRSRRRYAAWRFLPKGQLGLPNRSKPSTSDHEESRGPVPLFDRGSGH